MPMTSAEKMAAHRARQKEAQAASAAEDAYVAREVAVTEARFGSDPERLARSESYARFRWEGVADGSIAAL